MNPPGIPAEEPKPKRGRGRPRGTKNSAKKVVHPQSDLCQNGVLARSSNSRAQLASMPNRESVTNITIQPGHPIIYNYNYLWLSKDCGMLGVHPFPIPTQHNAELHKENESQGSREQIHAATRVSHNSNQRSDNNDAVVHEQEQNCEQSPPSESIFKDMQECFNSALTASFGVNSHMCQIFACLVKSYEEKKINYSVLESRVKALFSDYPDIIQFFYFSIPRPLAENIACDGYGEPQLSVGNTVTVKSNGPQFVHNEQSVLEQIPRNLSDDMQGGTPGEVSASPDDYSSTSSTTDNYKNITLRAVNWIKKLEGRLGEGSHKSKMVTDALHKLYKMNKHAEKVKESDRNSARQDYEQQQITVLGLLRDILKDESDLLEEMETNFASQKAFPDFPGKYMGTTPFPMEVDTDGSGTRTVEMEKNATFKTHGYNYSQRCKSPMVITVYDDEDEEARRLLNKDPPLITLDEDEDTGQQLTTLEINDDTVYQQSATLEVSEYAACQQLINSDRVEEQYIPVITNGVQYIPTWSSEPSDLPLLYHCQERWIYEICTTLSPILIKMKSLRNVIYNNLHVTLLRYDKDDCQSYEEETERKTVATTDCETDDEEVHGTYSMRPDTFHSECLGRTALCNEVLNDQYFTVAHRKKFRGIMRNKREERMDEYEDARFEVDMLLHRAARTIQVLKVLETKISKLSEEESYDFKLGDELGGTSIIHQHVVKLLYSRENESTIIMGLQKSPVLFVPGVLKILSVRYKEWSEFKARWSALISADLMKFKAKYQRKKKFLSHQRTQKPKRRLLWQNGESGGK